jgi:hypothetical protein
MRISIDKNHTSVEGSRSTVVSLQVVLTPGDVNALRGALLDAGQKLPQFVRGVLEDALHDEIENGRDIRFDGCPVCQCNADGESLVRLLVDFGVPRRKAQAIATCREPHMAACAALGVRHGHKNIW